MNTNSRVQTSSSVHRGTANPIARFSNSELQGSSPNEILNPHLICVSDLSRRPKDTHIATGEKSSIAESPGTSARNGQA